MGLQEELEAHLAMIEFQHGVMIENKSDSISMILRAAHDSRHLLSIALSLNHWVAVNGKRGNIVIPKKTLDLILSTVR